MATEATLRWMKKLGIHALNEPIGYIRAGKVMEEFREHFARTTIRIEDGADFVGVTVFDVLSAPCDVCGSTAFLDWSGVLVSLYECLGCGAAETQYDYRSRGY